MGCKKGRMELVYGKRFKEEMVGAYSWKETFSVERQKNRRGIFQRDVQDRDRATSKKYTCSKNF